LGRGSTSAPTFLPCLAVEDEAHWEEWLALLDGQAVGYIRGERSTKETCYVIRDPATFSLTGAYAAESLRGRGIASSLVAWRGRSPLTPAPLGIQALTGTSFRRADAFVRPPDSPEAAACKAL